MSSYVTMWTLAQEAMPDAGGAAGGAIGGVFMLLWLAVFVLIIAGFWKTFSKAGQPGWAAIIPIVNVFVLALVAGRPLWWGILMFIPLVNIIIGLIISIDVANRFGKGAGFGLGLFFLGFIFYPILGFGDAQYQGSTA